MRRQVILLSRDESGEPSPEVLAEFYLLGGLVSATYFDERGRRFLEGEGIVYMGEELRPSDGPKFFHALPDALATSSTLTTHDVDPDA